MAVITFGTNDNLTNKVWSLGLEAEVLKKTYAMKFAGKSSDSLLQIKDELSNKAGDRIRIGLRLQLEDDPLGSADTYEGNESALTFYTDDITIDETGKPIRWKTTIDAQRVNFDQKEEARMALSDYLAHVIDTSFFNQIAGYTAQSNTLWTGNNSVTAPTATTNRIFGDSAVSTDEGLGTGDTFTLALLDQAVEKAKTNDIAMRPVRFPNGAEYFVCFIHPFQVSDLRTSGSQWENIQRDLLAGGFIDKNPIFTGALGVYNGTVLFESTRVPNGVNSSTGAAETDVHRAIFCGAQSAAITWGRFAGNPQRFKWVEKTFDFEREQGIAAYCLYGLKKLIFNSVDFSTITISTFTG